MKYLGMGLIRFYQVTFSVVLPSSCRFTPSCSQYGYEAIERFGLFRGSWMAAKRISRCHPFYHGDLYDPVPERPEGQPS
jgi:hypothetical protein